MVYASSPHRGLRKAFKGRSPAPSGTVTFLVLMCAVILFAYPQNFAILSPQSTFIVQTATLVGFIFGVFSIFRRDPVLALTSALLAISATIASLVSGLPALNAIVMIAPLVVGAALGQRLRRNSALYWVPLVALVVLALSLVYDQAAGPASTVKLFGEPLRLTSASDTRARGLIGQPVPAALIGITMAVMAFVSSTYLRSARVRNAVRAAVLVGAVFMTLATGTRSALILASILVLLWPLVRPQTLGQRQNPLIGLLTILIALIAALTSWPLLSSSLSGARTLQFNDIGGSESSINRLYGLSIWSKWVESCDAQCVFGYGPRALQSELTSSLGLNGLTTVDNAYVTIAWDFGLVGLTATAALLALVVKSVLRRPVPHSTAMGVVGIISFLVSGIFYDVMYTVPALLILGFCVGLSKLPRNEMTSHA